jgi:phosphate-selective porin OprO/OprP
MARTTAPGRFRKVAAVFMASMLATWPGVALGQDVVPSVLPNPQPRTIPAEVGGGVAPQTGQDAASAPREGEPGRTGEPADRSPAPAAGGGSKASGGDPTTTGRAQEVGNPHLGQLSLKSVYDFDNDGFKWTTTDGEYSLGVRGMTQLDARVYGQPGSPFAQNGFYNPRTRVYFEGHLTQPIQYEFSFQNTFDTVALLDAYVNFNYDERFQVRIGRYKTPFTYEWYRVHIWDTLAPERSLFATNYEGQRRFGLMGWGVLLDNRIEYAVGTFNTQRNTYQPFVNLQDVMAFLNLKPFYDDEGSLWRGLQFGGSVDAGSERQSPVPDALRTNAAPSAAGVDSTSASNSATLPFLAFNPGVVERGDRALWELHTAYYCGGLSLMGAWQAGYEGYAKTANGPQTRVPVHGWFVQAGYLVTGETIRDRTLVQPLRPFDLRNGRFGLGAFEPTARYSELRLDPVVFTAGLANPTLWTNSAQLVDVGCNWYLNKFVKVYAGWEHATFASPVTLSPGNSVKSSDLFWLRTQVYF